VRRLACVELIANRSYVFGTGTAALLIHFYLHDCVLMSTLNYILLLLTRLPRLPLHTHTHTHACIQYRPFICSTPPAASRVCLRELPGSPGLPGPNGFDFELLSAQAAENKIRLLQFGSSGLPGSFGFPGLRTPFWFPLRSLDQTDCICSLSGPKQPEIKSAGSSSALLGFLALLAPLGFVRPFGFRWAPWATRIAFSAFPGSRGPT
jgi:hypothetical protein